MSASTRRSPRSSPSAVLERVDHRLGHALVGEQVARRDAAHALGRRVPAERALARVRGHAAGGVHARELAELGVRRARHELRDRLGRRQAAREQVEQALPERGIGDVLRRGRADAGARVRAARGDRRARGRDDDRRSGRSRRSAPRARTSWPAPRSRRPRRPTPGRASADDDEAGEGREDAAQPLAEHAVDRLAVADVGQVDRALADVGELGAALAAAAARRCPSRARPAPAGSPIATLSRVSRSCADLPAQVDRVAGDDGLAEVVVELLLGVGVLRVEGADAACASARSGPLLVEDALGQARRPRCTCRSGPDQSKLR